MFLLFAIVIASNKDLHVTQTYVTQIHFDLLFSTFVGVSACDLTLAQLSCRRHTQALKILLHVSSLSHPRQNATAFFEAPQTGNLPLLRSVLAVAEAPPPPVGLWNQ